MSFLSRRPTLSSLVCKLWPLLGLAFVGCVSVSMRTEEPKKSSGVTFKAPQFPYESFSSGSADASWRNTKTGSVISFLSECDEVSSLSLSSLRGDVLRSLQDYKIETEITQDYQGRESLRTYALGRLEGVRTAVDLVVVRRNDCNYTLSLIALPTYYGQDLIHFDQFLKGFRAP